MADMSELDALEAELDALCRPRPPAKTLRNVHQKQATCRFRAMVDAACSSEKWNHSKLARYLGVSNQFFADMYKHGRPVPGWVFEGMPREAREEQARAIIRQLRRTANV